jgi:HEAT repeat protein
LLLAGLVYLTLFIYLDFLRFAPERDELHFWPTALTFSTSWIPSLEQLRSYQELNTPLAFLIFGGLEHLLHGGIMAGRLLNWLLSFGITALIIFASHDSRRAALATAGLFVFPYYLGVSAHLYADVIAAAFVLLGLVGHLERKPFISAVCWSLAIATRQYAVAFPLAIAAYELFRSDGERRWIAPAASAATLGLWIWFFGGPAPLAELARQEIAANRLLHLYPSHFVYLLACTGLFYVIPELLLFPETRRLRHRGRALVLIVAATVLVSLVFAPLGNDWGPPTMGLFDRLAAGILGPVPRALLYAGLATLAAVRFSEYSPAAFLVAATAGILLVSHTMWEKYALALLVTLWYLRAREPESARPAPVSGKIGHAPLKRVMTLKRTIVLSAAALCLASAASAQQLRYDDVIRNLRNPDPKTRLSAVRLLRDAKYPESIAPMAPLVLDPFDDIQLETIEAELSFFLEQDVKSKKMVGFVIEKRKSAIAAAAFDLGPLAVWPRTVPAELVTALLQAVDDETPKVRLEAIYAAGVIARAPLTADQVQRLIKALDHYDPAVRAGAARVIARLKIAKAGEALIKAVNDSQPDVRYSALRALGAIRETRAVAALTEQFAYYRKGEGAWSALDALAQIGAPASVPIFKERLQDKDPYIRRAATEGLGRAGDAASIEALERNVTIDDAPMVRLATAFALQKLGRNYAARIVDLMSSAKVIAQGQEYLMELGPSMAPTVLPRIQDPDADLREALIDVMGVIGNDSTLAALQAAEKDGNASVAAAATRAVARIQAPK